MVRISNCTCFHCFSTDHLNISSSRMSTCYSTVGDKILKKIAKVVYWLTFVAHKVVSAMYKKQLIKPGDEWDEYYYVKATFKSLQNLDSWNFGALETINKNIFKQHSEMREHLQDRHQVMTTDIVEFLEQSTNVIR